MGLAVERHDRLAQIHEPSAFGVDETPASRMRSERLEHAMVVGQLARVQLGVAAAQV
jgi:hypothetical protein